MSQIKRIRRPADRKLAAWVGFRVSLEFAAQLKAVAPRFGGVAAFARHAAEQELKRLAPAQEEAAR